MAARVFIFMTLVMTFTSGQEEGLSLTFSIMEESDIKTFVGSVANVELKFPDSYKSDIRYNFLSKDHIQLFSLHDISGNISTMVKIDRETVCRYQDNCELTLTVAATALELFSSISVKIIVQDINDNAPEFPEETLQLFMSEGANLNSTLSISSAQDLDTGINSIQSYEINPESDVFGLLVEKVKYSNNFIVQIYLKKKLDREVKDSYRLRILAKDGGNPPKVGVVNVDVNITDINDHGPVFTLDIYNVSIMETTAPNTVILTLRAEDKDAGDNGRVSYRIVEHQANAEAIMRDFSVGSATGEVKIMRQLVYIADHPYSFIVEASDNAVESRKVSQSQVFVYVQDAGNNPPMVTVSLLSPGNTGFVSILENSKIGTFVAHILVEDSDLGDNGVVSCNSSNRYFSVKLLENGDDFKVVVENELNREAQDLHNVTVVCYDHGSPVLSSSTSFLVRVTDVNDNKPVFELSNYMASIYENTVQDQIILQVSANDNDLGVNQEVYYMIKDRKNIVVNSNGVISVKPFFDRETEPVVIFQVLAIDKGETPLTGTATVTLTVKDRNDNPPEFLQTSYEMEIAENLNSGTSIGEFSAKDLDIEENGKFTFFLSPDDAFRKLPFTVFADGVVQSNRALDREEKGKYEFQVIVRDQGEPSLSASAMVTVTVKDVNDNKPNITFPINDNRTVNIMYPDANNKFVTKVQAHDLDTAENGSLRYLIAMGNDLGLFAIDVNTGVILIADSAGEIDQDLKVTLLIEVSDKGPQPLVSTQELVINVIYSNATFSPVKSSENKFVIISVVVVIVTILISGVIIGVIVLLKYMDKKRKNTDAPRSGDADCGFNEKPSLYIINNSGESSTDYMSGSSDSSRKKKEVSFSLDDPDSLCIYQQEKKLHHLPEQVKFAPEKPPRRETPDKSQDLYDKVTTRLESLKLQQMLMETRAKQHQQTHPANPDDSRSETSGETIPSDSGRGASEEDGPSTSPSHDEQKMFDYSVPIKYSSPSNLPVSPSPRTDSYSANPPPIPCRTYKPYSSFNNYQSYLNKRPYYNDSNYDSSVLDTSVLSWQPQPHSTYSNIYPSAPQLDSFDYPSLPSQYHGSVKSRDDDDCSTTTSGSYTLQTLEDLL